MGFTERNPVMIGVVAVALMAAVAAGAFGITRSMFAGGYEITAEFADAAGLRDGDQVLIAGVRAGTVEEIEIAGDRVEATLLVDGHELTHDTRARITLQTLVGRRAVELEPSGDWSQTMEEGDRIPVANTELLVDVPEFAEAQEDLLEGTDADVLNVFLGAVTDTMRGQRDQVGALVEGGNQLTRIVNDQEQEVRELLRQLRTVSEVLSDRDEELVRIIDDFGDTVRLLAERREDLRRFFRETNATAATAADLVGDEREELDRILTEVHEITDVLDRRQRDLAEALAYLGDSIEGFASVAIADGEPVDFAQAVTTSLGPAGIDVLIGCGGLVDQRFDQLLGPDPRSCEEQDVDTQPDDTPGDPQPTPVPPVPGLDGLLGGQSSNGASAGASADEAPLGLDEIGRRALGGERQ
jgi:phospholipid/cholesterol/gamma-HCH transport system substrate-binding protein